MNFQVFQLALQVDTGRNVDTTGYLRSFYVIMVQVCTISIADVL
jgi:hypothetical protein